MKNKSNEEREGLAGTPAMSADPHGSAARHRPRVRHPLVSSKLVPPAGSPFQVLRSLLREWVCGVGGERVVLVRAPAGFGKTTLMLQAHALFVERSTPTAWLTADAADNDVGRFLSFLVAAFDRITGPAESAESIGEGGEVVGIAALELFDRIAAIEAPFALFLDDVESIQNPASLSLVRQVIENLPVHARLIIGSRTMPEIGSPRLLGKGHLLEIDLAQLRFSIGEASDFLQTQRRMKISAADITQLHRTTEGWPAALWLASLALERHGSPADLVNQFSGSNAAVADYLAEEVLARQSAEVRDFLLQTSILARLSAPLCDAVRGRRDSRELLDSLERANLFVERASDDGEWFRYHSLFSSFLRGRLDRERSGESAALHRAAAAWFESEQRPIPCIEHALASGDYGYALPLLARYGDRLLGEGRVRLLARLLGSVPAAELRQWPKLRLLHVWALALTRGASEAMGLLANIEAENELDDALAAHAVALRPMLLTMADRFDDAYEVATAQVERVTPAQAFPFSIHRTSLANLLLVRGDYGAARELLDRSRSGLGGPSSPIMTIYSQCVEGVIDLLHARLRQATARFRLSAGVESDGTPSHTNGNAMAGVLLAESVYEGDDLVEAERLLGVYVPLMQELGLCDHLVSGYRNLARIAHHQGEVDRAVQIITEMECFGQRTGLSRLVGSAQLERSRISLFQGDTKSARDALLRASVVDDWEKVGSRSLFGNDAETLATAEWRWMIHAGEAEQAIAGLKPALERAEGARRRRRALKLRTLLSLAFDRAGNEKLALRTLRDALEFGAREGFVRTFLDEGEPFQSLLRRLAAARTGQDNADALAAGRYLERLAATPLQAMAAHAVPMATQSGAPAESLTRRELELLALLSEGLSNLALAARLFVSETTVRTHLRNINAKLNVHNRTQAIAAARRLGLIA